MIEFSEMILAESLTQVAPFYMTDDTQIPSRITAAFKIDDTDYIFLFEKFLSEGLYKIEIIQMAGKTKRYWKFKNTNHIRIAFATAIKAFEASIPFMGTQVKGIAMPIPATLEKSYVKLAKFLLAKTYLANQFDYLPIDHTKSKFQYLMMVRKGQLAKNIFTAKYFKDYDFSSFDMQTKSMKAASFGAAKDNKQLIPGAAIEKIKPVVPEKPTYTLSASKKFTFKDVEFDDFSGTSEHPVFGVNSKNEKKTIVQFDNNEIIKAKEEWEANQAKKKIEYEQYEKKNQEWNEKFKEYTDQKLKEKGSAELKIKLLDQVAGEVKIPNAAHTEDQVIEKIGKLLFLTAPGYFISNYYGSYFDNEQAFEKSGYSKLDFNDLLYHHFYSKNGWANNSNNVTNKVEEVSKQALDELVSMGLKQPSEDNIWEISPPTELGGVKLGMTQWKKILYIAGRLAHSQHQTLDIWTLSKEFSNIKKKPDPVWYDEYEKFEIDQNTVTKHEAIAEISYDELEVVDAQKKIANVKGQGQIDFYQYDPSDMASKIYGTESYKTFSEQFYEAEFQAIYQYTGGDYSDINNALRKLYDPDMKWEIYGDYVKTANKMKKAFNQIVPIEFPFWVFRNTSVPGVSIPDKTFEVGEIIVDAAFLSTSLSYSTFDGGNTRFMIYVPAGSKVAPILNKSQHSSEREILLPPLSALKVIEVYCMGNKQHVKCIYIGNGMNSFFDTTVENYMKTKSLKESKIMKFKEYIMENKDKDKKIGKGIFAPGADNLSSLETLRKGAKDIKSGKIKLDKAPTPTKKS